MYCKLVCRSNNLEYNEWISDFGATILLQRVRKHLLYEYVPVMERTFRSDTRQSCVAQLSIYVILKGNEETRRYINQVRNVLRHLMLCYCTCVSCSERPIISLFLIYFGIFSLCSNDRNVGQSYTNENLVCKTLCSEFCSLCTESYYSIW
jgi:hypothetical protein